MRESYIPPVTTARELPPRWRAVWRFRLVVVVLLIALAVGVLGLARAFDRSLHQDPAFAPSPSPSASP